MLHSYLLVFDTSIILEPDGNTFFNFRESTHTSFFFIGS